MLERPEALGTFERPIIDSMMSFEAALRQNPDFLCPPEVLERQRMITVRYVGLSDGLYHQGQIVVDERLQPDVEALFDQMVRQRFPIGQVIPVADPRVNYDDEASMAANNTSGFNWRRIAGKKKLSLHAFGMAIDINPVLNPFFDKQGIVHPAGAKYDPRVPGTFTAGHPLVRFMRSRGWEWGEGMLDYHHFQKEIGKVIRE